MKRGAPAIAPAGLDAAGRTLTGAAPGAPPAARALAAPHPLAPQLRHFAPALVPELPLWLLPPDAPAWLATDPDALGWPYWAFAWPGGQALARTLFERPAFVAGRRVLDFGSGCAVEGLAAARLGAVDVLCADLDPVAAWAAEQNAASLGLSVRTTTENLLGAPGEWEVILAGDVCFSLELAAAVLAWLRAEAARGVLVLLGDPGRVPFDRTGLELVDTWQAPHDGDPRGGTLWATEVLRVR